jgi:xylose isomerase
MAVKFIIIIILVNITSVIACHTRRRHKPTHLNHRHIKTLKEMIQGKDLKEGERVSARRWAELHTDGCNCIELSSISYSWMQLHTDICNCIHLVEISSSCLKLHPDLCNCIHLVEILSSCLKLHPDLCNCIQLFAIAYRLLQLHTVGCSLADQFL